MIEIHINNIRSKLVGDLPQDVLKRINHSLSYELPGAFFAKKYNPYAGTIRLFSMTAQSFPTGLLHYVVKVLKKNGISIKMIDERQQIICGKELPLYGFKLRDYQIDAVNASIKAQRGILQLGTGGGKTNIFIALIAKLNVPTLILIHKTDIFWQIIQRLESALKVKIGRMGDGVCEIENITVGMIQTISAAYVSGRKVEKGGRIKIIPDSKEIREKKDRIKSFVETVECLITDEAHHVPADTFSNVHKKAKNAFYRFGMSASPWRENNDDMEIEAFHSKVIYKKIASSLIDDNYLVPPTIYLLKYKHPRKVRANIRYPKVYDDSVMNNEERNRAICKLALKAAASDKTVLIAITKIEHGKRLEAMLQLIEPNSIFVYGDSETELRTRVLKELDQRKRKIVICTTIFGEGIDVPNLDVLINAKAAKSSVDSFQLIGRILRKPEGKIKAYVVDIYDTGCKYIGEHSKERRKIYETEPRYELKEVTTVDEVTFDDKSQ